MGFPLLRSIEAFFVSCGLLRMIRFVVPGLLVIFLGVGCSAPTGESYSATVEGRVTLDGQPIANGSIQFRPGNSVRGSIVTLAIKDGHFKGKAIPGPRWVTFSATTSEDLASETIPKAYRNGASPPAFLRDLKPGNNELNFELTH
jgi:hypothetical protein